MTNGYKIIQKRRKEILDELKQIDVSMDMLRVKAFRLSTQLYSLIDSMDAYHSEKQKVGSVE